MKNAPLKKLPSLRGILKRSRRVSTQIGKNVLQRVGAYYMPVIPTLIDPDRLIAEVGDFFKIPRDDVREMFEAYRAFSQERQYDQTLGNLKTLSFEESFVVRVALGQMTPHRTIVEIGTQYGKSTRRLIDMVALLGLDAEVVCFDIANEVQHFAPDEAKLILEDVSGAFRTKVLDAYQPGFIYLDAHPYYLLKEVISEVIKSNPGSVLAVHDCGRGLCNPKMKISKDDPANISSLTGHWERHVLAEVVGIVDPLSEALDQLSGDGWRLRVFSTQHGLAVILPQ